MIRIDVQAGCRGGDDAQIIPADRDRTAGLYYLALGDWHGQRRIGNRCHYSGAPEQDRFRHDERDASLAVTIDRPRAVPRFEGVETGRFLWIEGRDSAAGLGRALPQTDRRETLVRAAPRAARLPERATLSRAMTDFAPEFRYFEPDDHGLASEIEAVDLDAIDGGGPLRLAAAALHDKAAAPAVPAAEREIAAAALTRLRAHVREAAH